MVVSTLFQLMTVGALLYLRTLGAPDWLAGLMLILAVADLITIPFTFVKDKINHEKPDTGENIGGCMIVVRSQANAASG